MPWQSSVCMLSKGEGTYMNMRGILKIYYACVEIEERLNEESCGETETPSCWAVIRGHI